MVKESTKPPKPKSKTTRKTTRNGNDGFAVGKPAKGRVGFNKDSRIEKRQATINPSKVPFLKFAKKKIGDEKEYKTEFRDSRKEKRQTTINPSKVPNLKYARRKFGDEKEYKTELKEFRKEKRHATINPLKVPFLKYAKKKIGDGIEYKTEKKQTSQLKGLFYKYANKFGDKKKDWESESAAALSAKPKKKKRVIRIDPYDISNKRLDDGTVLNDITNQDKSKKEKVMEEEEEKVELSRNAQFRAIKPSPSILSFVEDDLLGRRRDIELRRAGYNTELSAPLDNIPLSTSLEREKIEEIVFRNKMEFFAAAKVSSSFPLPDLPEIAFAGRSNVGKSSLLNALTRQWGVVRTSDKPGHTQTINFFKLGTKLCLVDLPGYGFAYAKEEVKESWEDLVKEYVSTRIGLKRVCLLIDTKWGMKQRDHELIQLMERYQTKYQIVLTKTDTVFPIDVARRAMQIEETLKEHKSVVQPTMMASSKSGAGIRSLRTVLTKIARYVKP